VIQVATEKRLAFGPGPAVGSFPAAQNVCGNKQLQPRQHWLRAVLSVKAQIATKPVNDNRHELQKRVKHHPGCPKESCSIKQTYFAQVERFGSAYRHTAPIAGNLMAVPPPLRTNIARLRLALSCSPATVRPAGSASDGQRAKPGDRPLVARLASWRGRLPTRTGGASGAG